MKKTVVIYDKWLHTLGGGEVVTCLMANILKDAGYEVTLLCGKKIPIFVIKEKLGVDLTGIDIIEVWNDEPKLKKLTENKDFFINTTFMDFTFGYADKNIYYTHFPSKINSGLILTRFKEAALVLSSSFIKQVEIVDNIKVIEIKHNQVGYLFKNSIRAAVSYLNENKRYSLKFSIFFENFYKSLLARVNWELENSRIVKREIKINQDDNIIEFNIEFIPSSPTIYLKIKIEKEINEVVSENRIYLLSPRVITGRLPKILYKFFMQRINDRLGAGLFLNPSRRLNTYQVMAANSLYTKRWIQNYWDRNSLVLYPPVEMLFKKHNFDDVKKNMITSVGRFFTSGHGKKQEILVRAFIKLYNSGYKKWQLHLIGGLSNDSSSLKFADHLKKMAKEYPIYFHFNVSRKEVEETLLKSKIYWHATGFGESETKSPEKFEHFGIAPIEAISAGCTPVLFNGGGLKEIINELNFSERNLFSSLDQLVDNTKYFIDQDNFGDSNRYFPLVEENFSVSKFEKELLEVFNG